MAIYLLILFTCRVMLPRLEKAVLEGDSRGFRYLQKVQLFEKVRVLPSNSFESGLSWKNVLSMQKFKLFLKFTWDLKGTWQWDRFFDFFKIGTTQIPYRTAKVFAIFALNSRRFKNQKSTLSYQRYRELPTLRISDTESRQLPCWCYASRQLFVSVIRRGFNLSHRLYGGVGDSPYRWYGSRRLCVSVIGGVTVGNLDSMYKTLK
jgi:hypothetical protein